jgi:cell division transport system permease protein
MNSIMSITSVFILTSCLILAGCFALLMLNANINLRQLGLLNQIVFFIDENYESEEELARIREEIRNLPNVESIKFIPKEEALERWKERFIEDLESFEAIIKDNPLDHSIEIEYEDINGVRTLVYQLRLIEGVRPDTPGRPGVKNESDVAEVIKNVSNIVMAVLIGFSVILFFVAAFIILNTVKLSVHARKQEIIIMRYIGATNFFIIFPFLLEGIIIGLISGIIAYAAQSYIYGGAVSWLTGMTEGDAFILEFINFSDVNMLMLLAFVFAGIICGLLGSAVSSRRYLKA